MSSQSFPVTGEVRLSLLERPAVRLSFELPAGYPETPAVVHLACDAMSRDTQQALNEWAQQRMADEEMQVMCLVSSLAEGFEQLEATGLLSEPPADEQESVDETQGGSQGSPNVFRMSAEELQQHEQHSGVVEGQIDRQWLTFVSFNSTKIAKDYAALALSLGLTGYLSLGKPGTSCIEGGPKAITAFLGGVRKDVFATVDKAARKMNVSMMEEACTRVRSGDPHTHAALSLSLPLHVYTSKV